MEKPTFGNTESIDNPRSSSIDRFSGQQPTLEAFGWLSSAQKPSEILEKVRKAKFHFEVTGKWKPEIPSCRA